MPFTVADLLDLPSLRRARPEVVSGSAAIAAQPVRWVHTSEIFEIAPLLKGGEVLLTTGLGLVAVSPDARRSYIADLARVGVAALVLELGRTFPEVPAEVVAEAARVGLPLVLLHGVVPFIEVTEAAHSRILGGELAELQAAAAVREQLLAALAENRGLAAFIGAVSEAAGCPAGLTTTAGELVAGAERTPDPAGGGGGEQGRMPFDPHTAVVTVGGEAWGSLSLHPAPAPEPGSPGAATLRAVLEVAVPLVAVEVSRSGGAPVSRHQAGADLLRDMVTGRYVSTGELASRAVGAGLVVRPGQKAIAICVHPRAARTSASSVVIAARAVAPRVYGAALVAEHEGDVLIGVSTLPRELRRTLARFAEELEGELRSTVGGGVIVSAGSPVDDVPALVSVFPSARETAALAARLTPSATVVLAADFALYQLLVSLVDDEALESFVTGQLGALLAHDARTGAGLVMTLDTYLGSGLSKTRTAETLGIRRQTLYGRLERIASLLGGLDLDNRERRTALDLALVSWRLRLAAAQPALLP
ncbi:PucR family transcriptional regulator [Herbiconiux sp. CPCC 203407]|uniref:PucR family transcriptional regulator n=1 Tax=Herbiconiux oxytropis TaxID=2970915 RepID=A0AA41XEX6_9MICO|nr:PucR family transcriptional regulator [Herbiconiux oxytropis]MCS5721636.1 PucR family transcriptional regulator [Herbiconiux oxytropis]MCS5726737.1 PucR family transcriptional regulator [Herbiconiux oxytropis]